MNPEIKTLEDKIRAQAEQDWRKELDGVIAPIKANLPNCTVMVGDKKFTSLEMFTILADCVFKAMLEEKQEAAITAFIDAASKVK